MNMLRCPIRAITADILLLISSLTFQFGVWTMSLVLDT